MITREDAVTVLRGIVASDVISEGYRAAVEDILQAIHYERIGLHLWGVDDDELMETEHYDNYIFAPSDFEEADIKNNLKMLENDLSEDESDEKGEVDKSID